MGETIFSSLFFFNISEISTNIKNPTKCSEYVMLKFTKQPKTPGITSKKTWLSLLKGISCLQAIFVLIWMKQTPIWFNFQREGTGNGLSNIKDTFAESLQLQMLVLHQSMCIYLQGWSLKLIWLLGKIWRKPTWCFRSQSKCWNNMEFQAQVYIT